MVVVMVQAVEHWQEETVAQEVVAADTMVEPMLEVLPQAVKVLTVVLVLVTILIEDLAAAADLAQLVVTVLQPLELVEQELAEQEQILIQHGYQQFPLQCHLVGNQQLLLDVLLVVALVMAALEQAVQAAVEI
jgi:hypothetical protein